MTPLGPESGQIYYADLGLTERKRILIVSNDELNLNPAWQNVICVYLTSKRMPQGPWVALRSQTGHTVANCTEILTIRKMWLKDRLTPDATAQEMTEVYRGIALALGAEPIFRRIYGS